MQKEALSNMLGSVGYFYGTLTRRINNFGTMVDIEDRQPASLLATVPSRARFARGFLWDEGFHLMLICQWDVQLCCEIIESWFSTMDDSGWIPSEQARGVEATQNIPKEFLSVSEVNDTPPVFLMVLQLLLKSSDDRAATHLIRHYSDWAKWFSHFEKRLQNDT